MGSARDEPLGGAIEEVRFRGPTLRSRPLLATLLTSAPTMSPERRNAMRATTSDACSDREGVVWLREEEVESEEREERRHDPASPAGDRTGSDHREEAE